jgi:hypothetical protein
MTNPNPPDDDSEPMSIAEYIQYLRNRPPRPGFPRKTLEEICAEQGVGPINPDELMALSPGPLYEGFEEDIRRMRNGQGPLGPRKPVDEEAERASIAEFIQRLRDRPPRPPGTGIIDWEKWDALNPGPLYEGFEDDVRRMRRGLLPLGPRK